MGYLRVARAVAGVASVFTLLSLILAETFLGTPIPPARIDVLLGLIAALLGLDMLGKKLASGVLGGRELNISLGPGEQGDDETD